MGIRSEKKAVSVIEDTAVAVSDLPAYVTKIQQIMANHKTPFICYGHASVGLLHLRPELDLREDKKTFLSIKEEFYSMARFKAEFLHHYHHKKGIGLKTRLLRHYALMLRLGAKFPRFSNRLANSTWLKKRLGVARQLPVISSQSVWWNRHKNAQKSPNGQVILLCDIFTQYHEPQIAQAAIQFLAFNGYSIIPIFLTDSPRLLISQGLLKQAKKALGQIIVHCYDLVNKSGMKMIGLEPSELLTLRDEAIDLVEARDKMRTLGESAKLFEEFILQELSVGNIDITQFSYKKQELIVHVHCHQKSLVGIDSTIQALKQLPGAMVTNNFL
ncbi:hypothetical protein PN36_30270 [Candidatus Thiomargarita nelsonii]|uniref:FAD-binding oxidoreductase/transferase type 4 C-terminal domain-containing protein n=1 Tax=Candidatus Thiomargarita nelsonii TaxID=1003181 RepID=A0A4E0QX72_9GAMM|nr:hypothetical protein PN36_30270 [Candidatus Thiomargarita nelsonii]